MEISEHIAAIRRDGELLVTAAARAGLTTPVPPCPAWQVRDLVRHQSQVHRWAAGHVAGQPLPELTEAEQLASGPADPGLLSWFASGCAALAATLESADPDTTAWTFLPAPSPLAFWARRQAHETAIHRADAELSAGEVTAFPADFAADGIDELLTGFFGRRRGEAGPDDRWLRVIAADADRQWLLRLSPDGRTLAAAYRDGEAAAALPAAGPATCLSGPASGLYQLLWNRSEAGPAGATISGDPDLLAAWRAGMQVTWS